MNLELLTVWGAIAGYAVSSILFIIGLFLGKRRLADAGVVATLVGLGLHGATIAARWVRVGHPPVVGFYEVALLLSFLSVIGFLLMQWRYSGLRMVGVAVMPVCFLILGATLLVSSEATDVSGSLASAWLAIHVTFAQLAFAFYIAGFVLAVAFLMRDSRWAERYRMWLDRLPEQEVLDRLTFKIVGVGFVFQGIMIASGAVWAHEAWGSYWSWDPIETWSLVAWVIYAVYLHLTLTMGWQGRKAAWVLVIALPVIAFSLMGVPIAYSNSVHGAYLKV